MQTHYRNNMFGKKEAGFTLVELAVALAIMTLLMAVAIPSFIQGQPRHRLKKAARDMVSAMQNARLKAVSENTSYRITFNVGANTYQITSIGADGVWGTADDPAEPAVNLANYGSGIQFGFGNAAADWNNNALAPASQRATLTYTNQGLSDAGSIFITNQDNQLCYAISTTIAGGKRLRKYNGVLPFNVNNWTD